MTNPAAPAAPDPHEPSGLWRDLQEALASDFADDPHGLHAEPRDDRDALTTLLEIYDLWTAPIASLGTRAIHQNHPAVASLKLRLEAWFIGALDRHGPTMAMAGDGDVEADGAVAGMRRIARRDLVPPVYDWLAEEASWPSVVRYLALEGGPDGGFDDLVALAQVGLAGDPKLALAANYWDEMGRGRLADVHTELHHRLVDAAGLEAIPRHEQPLSALERVALNGLLATNRWLQPEMIGALGLLEMQAGPRCRAVVRAFRRLGAPPDAFPFYEEHAHADPIHGKEWLERVVAPLATDPEWGRRMVRGASWRSQVNRRFFADAHRLCLDESAHDGLNRRSA